MVNHKEISLFSSLLLRCAHLCTATNAVLFSATKKVKVCGAPNPNPNHLLGGQEEGAVGG